MKKNYTKLAITLVSSLLVSVNGYGISHFYANREDSIQIQGNYYMPEEKTNRLNCCKSVMQVVKGSAWRLTAFGSSISGKFWGGVKSVLGGASEALYEVLTGPSKKEKEKSEQQESISLLEKVNQIGQMTGKDLGKVAGKGLAKALVATTYASIKVVEFGALVSKKTSEYIYDHSTAQLERYQKESDHYIVADVSDPSDEYDDVEDYLVDNDYYLINSDVERGVLQQVFQQEV